MTDCKELEKIEARLIRETQHVEFEIQRARELGNAQSLAYWLVLCDTLYFIKNGRHIGEKPE